MIAMAKNRSYEQPGQLCYFTT